VHGKVETRIRRFSNKFKMDNLRYISVGGGMTMNYMLKEQNFKKN
jgi:hypothetical protein